MYSRPNAPWFNSSIRNTIRLRRKLESVWKRTRTIEDQNFVRLCDIVKRSILTAKHTFYTNLVNFSCNSSDPKSFWSAMKTLLHVQKMPYLPTSSGNFFLSKAFANFFLGYLNKKPSLAIFSIISYRFWQSNICHFSKFSSVTLEVLTAHSQSRPRTFAMDPVTLWLIVALLLVVADLLCNIFNLSFRTGESSLWKVFYSYYEKNLLLLIYLLLLKTNLLLLNLLLLLLFWKNLTLITRRLQIVVLFPVFVSIQNLLNGSCQTHWGFPWITSPNWSFTVSA